MLRFLVLISFLIFSNSSYANKILLEKVKVNIILIDEVSGEALSSNMDLKVFTHPEGKEIFAQTAKKKIFYEITKGTNIKIKASAIGFYSDENIYDTSELSDGDFIEIRMSPKPSGLVKITTVDKENQKLVNSLVKIEYFSLSDQKELNAETPEYSYFYERQGTYKITTIADGFLNDVREVPLNISKEQLKTNLVIELIRNRMAQEIILFDKSNNNKINAGTAKITHLDTKQVVFEGKIINSKVKFDANRSDKYKIVVKGDGYEEFTKDFELSGTSLRFGLTARAAFLIDVYDEESNQRMATQLEITGPNGNKSIVRTNETNSVGFTPSEIGNYIVTSKAEGYINKSGTLAVKSLNSGTMFYTLRLKKGSNEYVITVLDAIDKTAINNAMVKVFNDKSIEIDGKAQKNQKKVNLDPEKKHFFEVSANGYFDYTGNIQNEKQIEVLLKKKEDSLEKTNIKVVDFQTLIVLNDAKVRIFDQKNNPVLVTFSDNEGVFSSDRLKKNQKYSFEVASKGYTTIKGDIESSKELKTILLKPTEINKYSIEYFDKFTKNTIKPTSKVIVSGKEILEDKSGKFELELTNTNTYQIVAYLTDYMEFKKILDKRELKYGKFEFGIFKEKYEIDFGFDNTIKTKDLSDNYIALTNKNTSKKEKLKFNEKGFSGLISPESSYFIEVKIPGFKPTTQPFVLSQVQPGTLKYIIKLIPETVASPVEENKVLVTITKNEIEKDAIPNDFKNIKKGVKYPLEGVNFVKSKTNMVPGAEKNLESLITYLKTNPTIKIEIAGHTDNEGSDQRLNQRLSEFRAKVVANYLFNKGINSSRIVTKGVGSAEPVVPNDTEENKAKNRRIEIMVMD